MSYSSIDQMQKTLQNEFFNNRKDSKKAAGRDLGTIVEIITYYLLKEWGYRGNIQIEKPLLEYGNNDISHKVEFSIHPLLRKHLLKITRKGTLTSTYIFNALKKTKFDLNGFSLVKRDLYKDGVVRNACLIADNNDKSILCNIEDNNMYDYTLQVYEHLNKPFSVFECKRVGVEDGCKKGPQTIEKAKQGAYVARTASALQKIRSGDGDLKGIIFHGKDEHEIGDYYTLLDRMIKSSNIDYLKHLVLTVGVVSNHGNWFTSDNQNKEMKVLSQSYDWLLFLTDEGLGEFVRSLILEEKEEYKEIREAFCSSYVDRKADNQFTKVRMNFKADNLLSDYFRTHIKQIESWFNVISPKGRTLKELKDEINILKDKKWSDLYERRQES